jgi:hypothetical protein
MAFVYDIEFPISDGTVIAGLKAGLTSWSGLSVQRTRPDTMTKRVVTVRNDSGPQEGAQSRRRYGINIFADSSVDAENLALDAMREARRLAGIGPITATDQFAGPFEIEEDPEFVFGGVLMAHFYFTFRCSVRGTNA